MRCEYGRACGLAAEALLTTSVAFFRQLSAFRFNWQRQWTHTCDENVRRTSGYHERLGRVLNLVHDSPSGDIVVLATGREAYCRWPCGCVQLSDKTRGSVTHCRACADGSLSFHDAENGEVRHCSFRSSNRQPGLTLLRHVFSGTQLLLLRKSVHASPVSVLDWRVNSAATAPKQVCRLLPRNAAIRVTPC